MEQEKTVTDIFEDIKTEMCDKFCRYPYMEWSDDEEMMRTVCEECPLMRL